MPLSTLVKTAGARWAVEETFQQAKGQVGLDQYQCRGWTAWHRFTILAMIALAILTVVATQNPYATEQAIALTVPEARRLINALLAPPRTLTHVLQWSAWRRRHQAQAKISHYKRRQQLESEHVTG